MWWEIALVGLVVAGCAAALIVTFTRSMRREKGACSCDRGPAMKTADRLNHTN